MSVDGPGIDRTERERADDRWLDEALAESFPASDPLPLFHGEIRPVQREDGRDSRPSEACGDNVPTNTPRTDTKS